MADEKENPVEGEATEQVEPNKSKKKKFIIFGAIGAGVLLVIIGVVVFLLVGKSPMSAGTAAPAGEHGGGDAAADGHKSADKEAEKADKSGEPGGKESHGGKKEEGGEGKGDKEAKSEASKGSSGGDKEDLKIEYGKTVELAPFNLNLGDPLQNRYVRLSVSIEITNEEVSKELERRKSQVRDAVISIVSRKTMEFLLTPDGKVQLRKEIKDSINSYMSKPINRVFITDILIE